MEFIGANYNSEEEKNKILETYDEFTINKLAFLNDTYVNSNTQLAYMIYYRNFFHDEEVLKGKDLMYFTTQEIKELMMSLITVKSASKGSFMSFANAYLNYCVERGYININNASAINTKEIKKLNSKVVNMELINLNNFYKLVEEVYAKQNYNRIILPVLFARYGILGEGCQDIMSLSFEDIDHHNKLVRIKKNGDVILLPIDENFIKWVYKASENDTGVILLSNRNEVITSRHTIYNMFYRFFSVLERPRISAKVLRENRKLDLLGEIRAEREIIMKDIEMVESLISYDNDNNSRTGILKLRDLYEVVFGENVSK